MQLDRVASKSLSICCHQYPPRELSLFTRVLWWCDGGLRVYRERYPVNKQGCRPRSRRQVKVMGIMDYALQTGQLHVNRGGRRRTTMLIIGLSFNRCIDSG